MALPRSLLAILCLTAACGSDPKPELITPDAPAASGCDPATVLPSNFRLVAKTSTGAVMVTTTAGVTFGTIDATAGGLAAAADNPYIYVDLVNGTKVAVSDLDARTSTTWDVALKRASLRINGGDSGAGKRQLAVVQATTLDAVTAGPATGYVTDDFATDDCMLQALPVGEPLSAFGEWYDYDINTHVVTPKAQVYVIERNDGTRTAFRVIEYYGDTAMPTRGAFYQVEWKQLPPK